MSLKGAVIGCGFFAQNHLKAWKSIPGCELVGVCDLDPAKAREAARLTGARAYGDAARMLSCERPDFVDIATTMETHLGLVELAAGHGCHVICQKPFAPDIATVRKILDAAGKGGIRLMVHENFRFQTPMTALKSMIDGDGIGAPYFAHISWRTGFDVVKGQPYLAKVERFLILDLGIHLFDLARYLLGDVDELYAQTQRTLPGAKGEASAVMSLHHNSGAVSHIVCGYTTRIDPDPFPQTLLEIEGREGALRMDIDYRLEHVREGSKSVFRVPPKAPAWADKQWALVQDSVLNTQTHFIECLASGGDFQTSGADNLKTFALVEAAYRSAETGKPIRPEV